MSMFKNMFKRGFWDDANGLSLMDFIASLVMISWGVVMFAIVIVAFVLMSKGKTMDPFWINFINVFSDVPLAVVIGLFGKGAFGEFSQGMVALKQSNNVAYRESDTGDNKGKSYGV